MPKIVKATETNNWLPPDWRKCTFPIINQPAKTFDDIRGSAFLLQYNEKPFIVSAHHVIDTINPVIAFNAKDQQIISISSSTFEELDLSWVKHPAGLDIAAIPFILPLPLLKKLDLFYLTEDKWSPLVPFRINDKVAHLGYPDKGTSKYKNGSPCLVPQGMPGKIIQIEKPYIKIETAATYGASGGPVFLNRKQKPFLIGLVIREKMYGYESRPSVGVPRNITTFLPASLFKDILEGKEIEEQFREFGKNLYELYRSGKPKR